MCVVVVWVLSSVEECLLMLCVVVVWVLSSVEECLLMLCVLLFGCCLAWRSVC